MEPERSTGQAASSGKDYWIGIRRLDRHQGACLLKATAIRMDAKEAIAEPCRMLATVGVFHLAI